MRAPDFWWAQEPDFRAAALAPLAALYGAIAARRMAGKGVAVDAPVICIGNFVAGGAGKTPTALAVANVLRQLGERPFFLSRGYGASRPHRTPLRVDIERHDAGQVGDEPLLLARPRSLSMLRLKLVLSLTKLFKVILLFSSSAVTPTPSFSRKL